MDIHIGNIIKSEAKRQGVSQSVLAERTNAKNAQNVDYDYKQESLSIDKLAAYSSALNHNFLSFYYEIEPFKTYRQTEIKAYQDQINELHRQLEELKNLLAAKEETVIYQTGLVETQKELIQKLKESR